MRFSAVALLFVVSSVSAAAYRRDVTQIESAICSLVPFCTTTSTSTTTSTATVTPPPVTSTSTQVITSTITSQTTVTTCS